MGLYDSITKGLTEAIEYEKGNVSAKKVKVTVTPADDFSPKEIKAVRNKLNMTQRTFASVIGVSAKTVEAWETGTNKPMKTACRLISMINADPQILKKFKIVNR